MIQTQIPKPTRNCQATQYNWSTIVYHMPILKPTTKTNPVTQSTTKQKPILFD